MKVFKKVISVALAAIICLSVFMIPISAIDFSKLLNKHKEIDYSKYASDTAPEGYLSKNGYINSGTSVKFSAAAGKKVLLVEDTLPWNSTANQTVLSGLTSYDKVTTEEFLKVNLSDYGVIVFANDQPFTSYENYVDFKEYMELFADIGGVIVFGACDAGWAGGNLIEKLPGNVKKTENKVVKNYIEDPTHPIVSASLSDGNPLLDSDLQSYYCSQVSFDESTLPAGSKVILRESDTDRPTLVEYPLGKGWVIASGLSWEHNYAYGGSYMMGIKMGTFAKKAMDDMFLYAMNYSSIDEDDLEKIEEYYLDKNAHHIVVADENSQPVENARISIDGNEYITDQTGEVKIKTGFGIKNVEVSVTGYRKSVVYYELAQNTFQIVVLEKDKGDGKPYVTMVSNPDELYDLRYQTVRVEATDDTAVSLKMSADWQGHGAGRYVIYQDDYQKTYTSYDGAFTLVPGQDLAPDKNVKLKLIAGNGTESDPIILNLFVDGPDSFGGSTDAEFSEMKFFEDKTANINDSDVADVFNGSFQYKFPVIPFEHVKEVKDDGTVVHKATIGVYGYDLREKEGNWLSYKKIVEDCAKKAEKTDKAVEAAIDKLVNGNGWISSVKMDDKLFNAEIQVIGYFEIIMDARGNVLSNNGTVVVEGSGAVDYTRLILLGPVPFYIDFGGGLKVEFKLEGLGYDFENKEWKASLQPHLNVEGSAYIGGGLGVSGLAAIGAEGSAKLEMGLVPRFKGDLTVKADLRAQLLWVIDWRLEIASKKFPLWGDSGYSLSLKELMSQATTTSMEVGSRNYASMTSEWYGNGAAVMAIGESSLRMLQEYIMPNTLPELVEVDGEYILLFHTDKADRTTGNNVVLMYSVYDESTDAWSEPLAVAEGVSSDLFAEYAVIDGELYVVWQKINREINASDVSGLLGQMSAGIEISFAKWNKTSRRFEQTYITSDNTLDMYPQIAVSGNTVTAVWVSNSANDALGSSGVYSFYARDLENGVWGSPRKLYETSDPVSEISAGYAGGSLQVIYAIDSENTPDNVYRINGITSAIVSGGGGGSSLYFEDGYFYWSANGTICKLDAGSRSLETIKSGDAQGITSSYRLVGDGNDTAVVWLGVDEAGNSIIYASMETANGWSNPIAIYKPDFAIQYFDVEIADDGSWDLVFTAKADEENVALVSANVQPPAETALNYVDIDETLRENGIQPVTFSVTNNGQKTLTAVNAVATDENGQILYQDHVSCNIGAGETAVLNADVNVAGISGIIDLFIEVYADDEIDLSDNNCEYTIGYTNVGMDVQYRYVGSKVIVTATVSNKSDIPSGAAISIIEDSLDGSVLDMKDVGVLSEGDSYVYIYTIDKANINFNGKTEKCYYINLEPGKDDLNEYDNSTFFVLYPEVQQTGHEHYDADGKYETDGNNHWLVCADCGDNYNTGSHVDSGWLGSKEPTCTEDGYSEWKKCTVCGYVLESGEVIPATGHTEITVNEKEATCCEDGYTGDVVCEDCGVTVQEGSVIPRTAHTEVTADAVEATCTREGYTGDTVCSACGATVSEGTVIPMKDHTRKLEGVEEATCQSAGYSGDLVCSECGVICVEGSVIPQKQHVEVNDGRREATCKSEGYTGDVICSECGVKVREGEIIPKAAHTEVIANKKNATCTQPGSTGDVVCSECGEILGIGASIPMLPHNETIVNKKKPTATKDGYSGDVVCEDCGELIEEGKVLEATDDDDDDDDGGEVGFTALSTMLIFGGAGIVGIAAIAGIAIVIFKKTRG